MTRNDRTRARLGALLAGTALALGGVTATSGPAHAAAAAPANLRAADTASKAVALTWDGTAKGAYRVRISTSSTMTTAVEAWDVIGNSYEWTSTDPSPAARAPRLTPGKKYYFQVKAITREDDNSDRENLSAYSKAVGITLPADALPELKPANLKATPNGAESMYVSWNSRGPGHAYLLRYTSDPALSLTKWKSVTTATPGTAVKGLTPGKKYYFRARVVSSSGSGQSPYSAAGFTATTATTGAPGISVATYNVRKMYSTSDWADRRKAVAANITSAAPDVVGLHEVLTKTWATNGKRQYADLMDLIGTPYALSTSGSGSGGTQLAYNTQRLSVVKSGSKMLTEYGANARYAVWAIFRDKASDKTFFAVTTHLEPGTATTALNDARIRQSRDVLKVIEDNSGGRPAVVMGDMNSSRSAQPSNGPYDVFTGAGYVDPTDNPTPTWESGQEAKAEHLFNAIYNTANVLERKARLGVFPVGTHIDYMFASPSIRIGSWSMPLKLDTSGSFVGTIPSDHNLIQMSINLP